MYQNLMRIIKHILYRLQWHIAPHLKYGKLTHIDIEINNNCNQKCLSCWHSEPNKLPFIIKTMDYMDVIGYIRKGYILGCKSIKFNLRGEPLLNRNLIRYIRYAKQLKYIDIMINTNGVLLTKKKMIELDKAGLTTCIISVDSLDPNIYCKLHGASLFQFESLYGNLRKIRKIRKFLKCKILFNFHINKLNSLEDFDFYKTLFPGIEFNIKNTMKREGTDITINTPSRKRKKVCPHMMRRLTVTANGKIYPCCVCYDEPRDIELSENSIDFISLREGFIFNYKAGKLPDTCKNCTSGDIYK